MFRFAIRSLGCAIVLSSLAAKAVQAQSIPGLHAASLAGTRWSGYGDCSRNFISLAPGGTLSITNGAKGSWAVTRGAMDVKIGTGWSGRMRASGPFDIGDPSTDKPGSAWTQCDPVAARNLVPQSWVEGTSWSGFGDCRVVIALKKGGAISMSNGVTGRWWVKDSIVSLTYANRPAPLELVRSGDRLVEIKSRAGFTRCG